MCSVVLGVVYMDCVLDYVYTWLDVKPIKRGSPCCTVASCRMWPAVTHVMWTGLLHYIYLYLNTKHKVSLYACVRGCVCDYICVYGCVSIQRSFGIVPYCITGCDAFPFIPGQRT